MSNDDIESSSDFRERLEKSITGMFEFLRSETMNETNPLIIVLATHAVFTSGIQYLWKTGGIPRDKLMAMISNMRELEEAVIDGRINLGQKNYAEAATKTWNKVTKAGFETKEPDYLG